MIEVITSENFDELVQKLNDRLGMTATIFELRDGYSMLTYHTPTNMQLFTLHVLFNSSTNMWHIGAMTTHINLEGILQLQ